jgi:hypothetical protein
MALTDLQKAKRRRKLVTSPGFVNHRIKCVIMVSSEARSWWEERRLRYNIGLVIAGVLAFVCYVVVVDRGISIGTMPDAEITLFTTAFQGIAYLFLMAIANICYFVGPLSESLIKPQNVERYRRMTFQLGLWFSVLLPFAIPLIIVWSNLAHRPTTVVR